MNVLRLGSRGPDVELLQTALVKAGYNIVVDGSFGLATERVLQSFQSRHGLTPDGIFGQNSLNAIRPYITGYTTHQIVPGDTLFNLANRYQSSIEAIQIANPNLNPYSLLIGQIITIPHLFSVTPTNISYTSNVLSFNIEGLKARYPFIKTGRIGYSTRGTEIPYLAIGEGENEVFYNASHHANEWITTPVLMKFLEDYAAAYSRNGQIFNQDAINIYTKTTIYIVPMVNPDGVDLVTGLIPEGSAEYNYALSLNNYLNLPFPSGWKANLRGVDLNLNYPAGWKNARDIKFAQGYISPGPRDFVGPNPMSEPESQAMAIFTLQHFFRLTLSYHTQGEVIFWRFLDFDPPSALEIGEKFAQVSGYTLEETPLSSSYAGYKDWFIQTYNLPGYTIEAGRGINPLPITDFNSIYENNVGILVWGAQL